MGAHLALLEEHARDDLIEQADQAEHGVVWQVFLRKFALCKPELRQIPPMSTGWLAAGCSLYTAACKSHMCTIKTQPALPAWVCIMAIGLELKEHLAGIAGVCLAQHCVAKARDDAAAVECVPHKLLDLLLAGCLPDLQPEAQGQESFHVYAPHATWIMELSYMAVIIRILESRAIQGAPSW
jgi:hypothetical protein